MYQRVIGESFTQNLPNKLNERIKTLENRINSLPKIEQQHPHQQYELDFVLQELDELKYKNQGETWMGPMQNGPIDRGGYFYSK